MHYLYEFLYMVSFQEIGKRVAKKLVLQPLLVNEIKISIFPLIYVNKFSLFINQQYDTIDLENLGEQKMENDKNQ
jgi:hypothetical protein